MAKRLASGQMRDPHRKLWLAAINRPTLTASMFNVATSATTGGSQSVRIGSRMRMTTRFDDTV
jgi:hypothetical protein